MTERAILANGEPLPLSEAELLEFIGRLSRDGRSVGDPGELAETRASRSLWAQMAARTNPLALPDDTKGAAVAILRSWWGDHDELPPQLLALLAGFEKELGLSSDRPT